MMPESKMPEGSIKVGSGGFVKLVDVMGNDGSVVQAARVSYGAGTKSVSDDRGLIRYLMRKRHTTPFEMAEMKFLVRVPMDTWRQWIRHRTASVNEYSTRYSEAIDECETVRDWRLQATGNKQGSATGDLEWPEGYEIDQVGPRTWQVRVDGILAGHFDKEPTIGDFLSQKEKEFHQEARDLYRQRLEFGIAREQARKDLPLSNYTEAYWKCDLHNLLGFLRLRLDSHAQLEIREYAEAIAGFVKERFPLVWEAFQDYVLDSVTLTGPEIKALTTGDLSMLGKREIQEFEEKKRRINGEYLYST